jgi:TPR repeat protein
MSGEAGALPVNYRDAVKWCYVADKQGSPAAANNLGLAYGKGLGVPQNYSEALRWYEKSASEGSETARRNITALTGH